MQLQCSGCSSPFSCSVTVRGKQGTPARLGSGSELALARRGAIGPLRITLFGCPAADLPRPGGPAVGPLSPSAASPGSRVGLYRTETFFVGSACFARISAYHAVAHFERRLLSRLREELRRALSAAHLMPGFGGWGSGGFMLGCDMPL